ncbi:myo-inositol-1(or 4)-monophosphatase [Cryptococcus wingfieldii CBS 7118]|uniref:Inositol-1-monophosphatase n=1 Tax=Cryptococcus wingfieldii CBS 7118 TaxID=1295528 RepID=A0A1E3K627_9TREE|nr:myo-inositol-1(or 4)-monophosphatase [Cryptococcus wingfieldii CBS 7118]ODO08521.1 myo-inositol-1(or 4)-monophosphatase [Cryptococcus wingfieldii CBS 7118]
MQYKEIYDFAYSLAEKASATIVEASAKRWTSTTGLNEKKNSVDLVTETDEAVEKMIKDAVAERYPSHKFIGEESYAAGDRPPLTDDYTWIVDPIDVADISFVHSYPFVACSIGVAHKSKPIVGVIALPFMKQIFSAYSGGGATLNQSTPLPLTGGIPQPLTDLSRCMIGAEWGSDRGQDTFTKKTSSFAKLAGDPEKGVKGGVMAHALRTTGSTACNAVAVAAGQLDVYWDAGCYPWDVCAAAIILQETGGYFAGGKNTLDNPVGKVMMGRRYIFVRAVPPTEKETSYEIQARLAKELYEVVDEWTNEDMM